MCPCETKSHMPMIESRGPLEAVHPMTIQACGWQGLIMNILVTSRAFGVQTEKGARTISEPRVNDVFGFVASTTVHSGVRPDQCPAGLALVVEWGRVQPNHFEVPTVVFTVTRLATLRNHLFCHMKPSTCCHTFLQHLVAIQAPRLGNFRTHLMAICAMAKSFQMGMGVGQVAWGKLGKAHRKRQQQSDEGQTMSAHHLSHSFFDVDSCFAKEFGGQFAPCKNEDPVIRQLLSLLIRSFQDDLVFVDALHIRPEKGRKCP